MVKKISNTTNIKNKKVTKKSGINYNALLPFFGIFEHLWSQRNGCLSPLSLEQHAGNTNDSTSRYCCDSSSNSGIFD